MSGSAPGRLLITPDLGERDLERFVRHVAPVGGCIVWTGALTHGYGTFGVRFAGKWRTVPAHRVAWFFAYGYWPAAGVELDHECHNADRSCSGGESCPHRACVMVEHLVEATPRENNHRGRGGASRTHCPAGHPYSEENTYRWAARPMRICRICHAASERARRARARTGQ